MDTAKILRTTTLVQLCGLLYFYPFDGGFPFRGKGKIIKHVLYKAESPANSLVGLFVDLNATLTNGSVPRLCLGEKDAPQLKKKKYKKAFLPSRAFLALKNLAKKHHKPATLKHNIELYKDWIFFLRDVKNVHGVLEHCDF